MENKNKCVILRGRNSIAVSRYNSLSKDTCYYIKKGAYFFLFPNETDDLLSTSDNDGLPSSPQHGGSTTRVTQRCFEVSVRTFCEDSPQRENRPLNVRDAMRNVRPHTNPSFSLLACTISRALNFDLCRP